MMLIGGSWSELSNRLIDEASSSVARVVLSLFPGRSKRDIELLVSQFGGKPRGEQKVATFSIEYFGQYVCGDIFLIP